MKLFRFVATAAMSLALVGMLAAQAPQQQQPPTSPRPEQAPPAPRAEQPGQQPAAQAREAAETTIVGCLAQSQEAADVYTLTVIPAAPAAADASPAAPATTTANTPPDAVRASGNARSETPRAASASDAAASKPATYKITGIAADQLKPHVNHHVEIKGRISAAAGAQADAAAAPEFRGSSVKMLNATCPAAK